MFNHYFVSINYSDFIYFSYLSLHSFGGKLDDYPHPELDFTHFLQVVEGRNHAAGQTWDPVTRCDKAWIDKKKLSAKYGPKGGCTIS